ncbi:tetratricopeptide repeat protein [bacterium SCSIO 12643]|nr:tetratricopeptide repeat protein [bacterium SCSIO 12643]
MNQKHKKLLAGILIGTLFVYLQSLSFDFVNWDDDYYVINNLEVTNPTMENLLSFFTQGNTANYHPITMLSLAFNYALGGENAFGYHLFNLIFHVFNTVLLYVWVQRIWPTREYLPLFIAGVFALHPMHVESVAWISSRKDVLFFCFYFLGLLSYQEFHKSGARKYLIGTLLFFIFSALSKPTAVIFPIHLLLIDYLQSRELSIKLIVEKVPFFLVSVMIGLATVLVQTDAGAVNVDAYSVIERLQLASYALNMYIAKFIAPMHLSSFYPYPSRPFEMLVSIAPIIFAAGLGGVLWKWRQNRNVVFGVLFFLSSLALLVQLVTVGSTIISERYTYLAYVGLSLAIYFILEDVAFNKLKAEKNLSIAFMVVLIGFSLVSFNRVKVWKSGETLWTDAIEKFPEVAGSWGGRGVYYRMEKKYTKALKDLNQAVALNPNEAMFYSNRGNIFFDLGQDDNALFDYNNCIRLDSTDENAFANRGAIFGRRGQYDEAVMDLSRAIDLDPDFVNAYMNRGIIYSVLNQREQAKNDYRKCVELEPDNHGIWNAIAVEYQYLGAFDSSVAVLNTAIQLEPNEGIYYFNRGISYRLLGDQTSANADFDYATTLGVQVDPGYYQPIN